MTNQSLYAEICKQLESIGCVADNVVLTGRGNWKRLDSVAGKARNGHISYWLDSDDRGLFGFARNHHSGEESGLLSYADYKRYKGEEREAVKRQIAEAKKQQRDEIEREQANAASHAVEVIKACRDVSDFIDFDELILAEVERRRTIIGGNLGAVGGYIADKGIVPYKCRYWPGGQIDGVSYREMLVIPRHANGAVSGFQRIVCRKDGGYVKLYQDGSVSRGALYALGQQKPDARTIVCEGWATACSIYEATGDFVLIAFDCNNILPVIEYYRGKNPEREIIIAADSDQWRFKYNRIPDVVDEDGVVTKVMAGDVAGDDVRWEQWRQEGRLENMGLIKAHEAASHFGLRVCEPGFDSRDAAKKSDFNDLHLALGLDAVRERISSAKAIVVEDAGRKSAVSAGDTLNTNQLMTPMPEWRNYLRVKDDGEVVKTSIKNQILVMASSEELRGAFRYDPFFNAVMVTRDITGGNDENFQIRRFDDTEDVTTIQLILEEYGVNPPNDNVIISKVLAISKKNPIEMLKTRLDELCEQWDGVNRLDSWLEQVFRVKTDGEDGADKRYISAIGKCWMIAAVSRVYKPGCKFDHVLMVDGLQGAGKTTVFHVLSDILEEKGDEAQIYDDASEWGLLTEMNMENITSADGKMQTEGKLIVLMDEIVGFAKRTDAELKTWIQAPFDEYRRPYGRGFERHNRKFVIAGTTNQIEYLRDVQNRRYWTFTAGETIDVKWLLENRRQLWGEAVALMRKGVDRYLVDDDLKELQRIESTKRRDTDLWEPDVRKAIEVLGQRTEFSTVEVVANMDIATRDKVAGNKNRVCDILRTIGYREKSKRLGKNSYTKVWVRTEPEPDMSDF